ncbi:MAG: hypothetical protein J7539_06050 [Niabella sp.]|nr:hypothetical protein [Niabella sp.]
MKLFRLSGFFTFPADGRRFFAQIFAENQSADISGVLDLAKISGKAEVNIVSVKRLNNFIDTLVLFPFYPRLTGRVGIEKSKRRNKTE